MPVANDGRWALFLWRRTVSAIGMAFGAPCEVNTVQKACNMDLMLFFLQQQRTIDFQGVLFKHAIVFLIVGVKDWWSLSLVSRMWGSYPSWFFESINGLSLSYRNCYFVSRIGPTFAHASVLKQDHVLGNLDIALHNTCNRCGRGSLSFKCQEHQRDIAER